LPAGVRALRRRGRARRARGDRMRDVFRMERMWRPRRELKESYDVVIIGAGSHGLATAYYLAKNHGITDVAVLEQSYIGSGAAGRLARAAARRGVETHPYTKGTAIERSNGRVTGVRTTRGDVEAGTVINATAGWSTLVADLAGVQLPITTHILQAFVTEPLKPFLDVIIVSSQMHVYISQTDRGEFLIGAEIEPYTTYLGTSTFPFLEYSARHTLELFPQLESAKVLRQWTGLCDLSPDYSPILGVTEVDGFLVSCGWGTYGFKAAPIVGTTLAEL